MRRMCSKSWSWPVRSGDRRGCHGRVGSAGRSRSLRFAAGGGGDLSFRLALLASVVVLTFNRPEGPQRCLVSLASTLPQAGRPATWAWSGFTAATAWFLTTMMGSGLMRFDVSPLNRDGHAVAAIAANQD